MRSTDDTGLFIEAFFVISINDVPEAPTNIYFVYYGIPEYSPIGTVVGRFLVEDEDFGRRLLTELEFEFCSEREGNDYFAIRGNELIIAKELDFDNVENYEICI